MTFKPRGAIQLCIHCGSKAIGSSKFCEYCKTAEGRRSGDAANEKHFKDHGLEYHCEYCENEKKQREKKLEKDKKFKEWQEKEKKLAI